MPGSRDETKDLDAAPPPPSSSRPSPAGHAAARLIDRLRSAWIAVRAGVLWALLAAGALSVLIIAFILPISDRPPESHTLFAALVMRRSGPEMVDKSVGGLHAGEFLADIRVQLSSGEPLPGQAWLGVVPRVKDRASFAIVTESGAVANTSADAARAFLTDQQRVRAVVASAVDRIHPALRLGDLISRGEPERTRLQPGIAVRTALLTVSLALAIAAGAVWATPRVRALLRARAIERGQCPKCRLGLANLRDRRCPQCGLEVTPGEFNRLRAVWREKGVGVSAER